jgi:predicted GNAT family acetyltransferase
MTMEHEVRRDDAGSRYELLVDGRVAGVADFVVAGTAVVVPHTEIDAARRGAGLGALLVEGVLADIRAQGRTVVPTCWYVRQYMAEHPETADLLA